MLSARWWFFCLAARAQVQPTSFLFRRWLSVDALLPFSTSSKRRKWKMYEKKQDEKRRKSCRKFTKTCEQIWFNQPPDQSTIELSSVLQLKLFFFVLIVSLFEILLKSLTYKQARNQNKIHVLKQFTIRCRQKRWMCISLISKFC